MAIQVTNPNLITIQNVGVGILLPFSSPSVFTSTQSTIDQLRYDLINFILTNHGERVLEPNFGCNLRPKLFEQLTPNNISNLESYIISQIQSNFPQIVILSLTVTPIYEQNSINLEINYSVLNSETQTLQITI
jgi:phage baseplate assembly protein W